jgi:uncharacterized protein (TIGR02246 family)
MNQQHLADELAVRDLAARFTDAVNRDDPTALGALFTSDGEWVVPGVRTTVGPDAAAEQIRRLRETFVHLVQVLHSGHVDLDGDTASAVWYLSENAATADGSGFAFTGVYHDELRRTGEGWRFARRTFSFLYRGKTELSGKWYAHPAAPARA